MRLTLTLSVLFAVAALKPSNAQQHHPQQSHPSAPRAGQGTANSLHNQHELNGSTTALSPQVLDAQARQQFYYMQQQMMLDQMANGGHRAKVHRQASRQASQAAQHAARPLRPSGGQDSNPDLESISSKHDRKQSKQSGVPAPQRETELNSSQKNDPVNTKRASVGGQSEPPKTENAPSNATKRTPHLSDIQVIAQLRYLLRELQKAGGDYEGHRARAVEHLETAIHHMGALGSEIPKVSTGGSSSHPGSDDALNFALGGLKTIEISLGTTAANAFHHHSARAAVSDAIRELQTALRIADVAAK
jgi:hypothetical protein